MTKPQDEWLAAQFEANRSHLRSVAYRMLGSLSEADDAVQEAWLRLTRTDAEAIQNLAGWLTTVVGRVCLDMLRSRRTRREETLGPRMPEPIVGIIDGDDPEQQALLADSVGLALLVVLETLSPAERIAFVLHDVFAVQFDEIAPIVDRSPGAARQLASRARRRVRGMSPAPSADVRLQRKLMDAFLSAAREGDFDALVAVLDPEVVLHADLGARPPGGWQELHGAETIARQAMAFARMAESARPVLVNGAAGILSTSQGQPLSLMAFTVRGERIVEIDILADPDRLNDLDPALFVD